MSFQSEAIISAASQRFGTIDYSRWQALRWQWYAWITYPALGASELNFFGNAVGQGATTLADTNLPKAGSFGQTHFLVKTISTGIKIGQENLDAFSLANLTTNDTQTLSSDILLGFAQAGVLSFNIGARPFATIPKPFMYAPPTGNEVDFDNAYVGENTFIAGPPPSATDQVVGTPLVKQTRLRSNVYRVDPNILIEAEQQFEVKINFPSGNVPIISTAIATNADVLSTLKVGVILDGVLLRPMQ
jgi:hypothetical protein